MVLIIVSVLAVAAMPVLFSRLTFDTRRFADQVRAAMQYAQKVAVAQRRNVCVTVTASSLSLTQGTSAGAACSAAVFDVSTGSGFVLNTPSSVSFGAAVTITFDALGKPVSGAATVTVAGDQSIPINVEAETGYVR
jgi:MSHA pilin protein MshC